MSEPKFKVGDKLEVFRYIRNRTPGNGYAPVQYVLTVKEITNFGRELIYWFEEYPNGNYESELELSKLARTKLYKALK